MSTSGPLPGLPDWVAHTPTKEKPDAWHLLYKHAREVADFTAEFARPFGAQRIGEYLGILHDLGKFKLDFQQYLLDCHEGKSRAKGSVPHKHAGALAALTQLEDDETGTLLGLPLHGHHGGMRAWSEIYLRTALKGKTDADEVRELLALSAQQNLAPKVEGVQEELEAALKAFGEDARAMELWVRMLYSCLVDADGLSTESHTRPESSALRRKVPMPCLETLLEQLTQAQEAFGLPESEVDKVRHEVYEACRAAAKQEPGLFRLTVPTGGGKTRSSLAFALEHATIYTKHRVIYAIPYTSIIEQTVEVFQKLFHHVPGAVLEHHSAVKVHRDEEGGDEELPETDQWRQLATENWSGASVIVTTTVQLFESLFAHKPSACRKLHRLANSVIVLDEVQMLPPSLLEPIISTLQTLVTHFGATVVLCTATQPALENTVWGFTSPIRNIVSDPQGHFRRLKRVTYETPSEPWSWERVAAGMAEGTACLTVVNTRRQAQELIGALKTVVPAEDIRHLSTLLCGKHRGEVLTEVRQRLKSGKPIYLVSTTCIECGVDLDFPRLLRAVGPLDRILQAAGRCNREGKRPVEQSIVTIFTPEEEYYAPGPYGTALEKTKAELRRAERQGELLDFDDPAFITAFFAHFYADVNTDAKKIQPDRADLNYPEVARKFRMIDQNTISVFVRYDAFADALLDRLKGQRFADRDWWREASPYFVSLYPHDVKDPRDLEEGPVPGLTIWNGRYDALLGIPLGTDPLDYEQKDLQA